VGQKQNHPDSYYSGDLARNPHASQRRTFAPHFVKVVNFAKRAVRTVVCYHVALFLCSMVIISASAVQGHRLALLEPYLVIDAFSALLTNFLRFTYPQALTLWEKQVWFCFQLPWKYSPLTHHYTASKGPSKPPISTTSTATNPHPLYCSLLSKYLDADPYPSTNWAASSAPSCASPVC
jgi:hypothetical protein